MIKFKKALFSFAMGLGIAVSMSPAYAITYEYCVDLLCACSQGDSSSCQQFNASRCNRLIYSGDVGQLCEVR